VWCVVVCDLVASTMRRSWPTGGGETRVRNTSSAFIVLPTCPAFDGVGWDGSGATALDGTGKWGG
jgi:hypothetical protein